MDKSTSTGKGTSPLELIPTEFLLHITTFIPGKDLAKLSLTNRNIRLAAEESLYKSPKIRNESNFKPALVLLYRTLAENPRLASMVKNLDIEFGLWGNIIESSALSSSFPEPCLKLTFSHPGLVGWVLSKLSDLDKLVLATTDRSSDHCFEFLFDNKRVDPMTIPAFRILRTLSWGWGSLPWSMSCLPTLTTLIIPIERKVSAPEEGDDRMTAIKSFSLQAIESIFLSVVPRWTRDYGSLRQFLARCPLLTQVSVSIKETYHLRNSWGSVHLGTDRQGSYSVLQEMIAPTSQTLEKLDLGIDDDQPGSFLDHVSPIGSLTGFEKLTTLRIPYEALIEDKDPTDTAPSACVTTILPSSLERLEVQFPGTCILAFLEAIFKNRAYFPNLKMIILYCSKNYRGVSYETFRYRGHLYRGYSVIASLQNHSVQVELRYRECDKLECWSDDNYDPLVMDIVDFLHTLNEVPSYQQAPHPDTDSDDNVSLLSIRKAGEYDSDDDDVVFTA